MTTKMQTSTIELDTSISQPLSKAWETFFSKFNETQSLPIPQWKSVHLVSYFTTKYKSYYGINYTFTFSSTAPSKSTEVILLSKISMMLSSDPVILKDYIDYFFEEEIQKRKRRINSIAALAQVKPVNEYKFKKLMFDHKLNISRSTSIPPNYLNIIKNYCNISTYGELAFIIKSNDPKFKPMADELIKAGLDITMIDKIK